MQTNTEVYHIYFDPELGAVVMKWEGYATSAQFREGTELMLNTLIHNKASKVLADITKMDQHWLETVFLPRATTFGFKVIAIVKPENYFNKVAIESISLKADKEKLNLCIFDHPKEAKTWLRNL